MRSLFLAASSPIRFEVHGNCQANLTMNAKRLLNGAELEDSPVVANCCMNRERDLRGSNGYEVELGFDPLAWLQSRTTEQGAARWLDLCCGSGKALIQAARLIENDEGRSIQITGVDLVGMFLPNNSSSLELVQCSVFEYAPTVRFDLITCVYGLHYLGDKLRAIQLTTSWLTDTGTFVANLEANNMCISEPGKGSRKIVRFLRDQGFEYLPAKHLIRRDGHADLKVPFCFLGADDSAGPNYTKQPVVDSYYEEATVQIEDVATAYHEAGHAVIAVTLGRPVEKVTIQRNSLRLGQCQISNRRGQPVKDALEVQALILFAGVVCEARILGQYNWPGAQQDMIGIRQLARNRGGSDKQIAKLQQRWLDKTEYLVDDETWESVHRVAQELLVKRSLSGRAVQHIVENRLRRRPPNY